MRNSIGGEIREYREGMGMSQKELASIVGTYQTAISKMERGLIPPSQEVLQFLGFTEGASQGSMPLNTDTVYEGMVYDAVSAGCERDILESLDELRRIERARMQALIMLNWKKEK